MARTVVALALALASCSSGAPASRWARTIVVLGDSITEGTQRELPAITKPYPTTLQRRLGDGWMVKNLGVAGSTARDVRLRWTEARRRRFSIAVVMVGVNDLRIGTPAAEAWEHLQPTYDEVLADGMRLVAVTVTPFRGWKQDPWTPEKQAELESLNSRIVNFCAARGCAVVHALLREYDYGDHLHLSQAGLDRLADLLLSSCRSSAPAPGAPRDAEGPET
jgi:lysophospholipase L1-like esterase